MSFLRQTAGAWVFSSALLTGLAYSPAQAGYLVTLEEVGSDVVATGSGPIDLTSLIFFTSGSTSSQIVPFEGVMVVGATSLTSVYAGLTGPRSFGRGGFTGADRGSGDIVSIGGIALALSVPFGYFSGDPLSNTATYVDETLSSLGVTPGTYVWSWGTGGPDQNFTLIIPGDVDVVPEPTSVTLLGVALAGLLLTGTIRRKRNRDLH